MNCHNCNNPLPAGAGTCPVCGAPAGEQAPARYRPPEGFVLDPSGSGLYYQSTMSADTATGAPVQYVTWFDAVTGEYSQTSYTKVDEMSSPSAAPAPQEEPLAPGLRFDPAAPHETPPTAADMPAPQLANDAPVIPEGFTLDLNTGKYTRATQGNDPQTGAPVQWITTYDPKTGRYDQSSQPMAGATAPIPPLPAAPQTGGGASVGPAPMPPSGTEDKPDGKKKIIVTIVLVLVIAALAVLTVLQGWYKILPFFNSDPEGTSQPIPDGITGSAVPPSFSPYVPSVSASSADVSTSSAASSSSSQQQQQQTVDGLSALTDMWYDHPHVNEFYMRVQEDADHIYFHQPGDEDYMSGTWFRMDKDGGNLVSLNRFASGTHEVSGFALLGDMLYFAVPTDYDKAAYYRVHKSGGTAELLFLHEKSYMLPYKGSLYMIFPEQRAFGAYTPDTDRLPRLTTLVEWDESNDAPPAWLMNDFCLYDGWFYYGEQWDDACTFYRYHLATGEREMLLSGAELQQSFVFDVIFNGDQVIYNHLDWNNDKFYIKVTTLRGTSHETITGVQPEVGFLPFIAKAGDRFLYQQGAHYNSVSIANPTSGMRQMFTTYSMPYGVNNDWIFYKGELINHKSSAKISTGSPANGPSIDILDAQMRARELAAAYPDEWGIAS